MIQRDLGIFESTGVVSNRTPDVQYTLGGHYIRRRGPVELSIGVTGVYELNRLFHARCNKPQLRNVARVAVVKSQRDGRRLLIA